MRKFSLLLGTLGGAMAGYLFSNKRLREELSEAKDAEAAARLLGKHLQRDGKKVAKEVQKFVQSDHVQENLTAAQKYAKERFDDAKEKLEDLVGVGAQKARKTARKTAKKAARKVKMTARRLR